jgi:Ribbon-helix-helix protein, copG family
MSTTTRITISVPTDLAVRLDAEAKASDRTASAIVRRALRAVLPSQFESPPLGGQGHATLPGTPATAAALGHGGGSMTSSGSAPLGGVGPSSYARPAADAAGPGHPYRAGSTSNQEEPMPDTPLREIMERCTAPVRRQQEQHAAAQTGNQCRRNTEAGSPAPAPRGAGTDEH